MGVVFHQWSFMGAVFDQSGFSSVVFHQSGLWSVIFSSVVFGQSRLFIRVSDHGSVIFSSESSLVRVAFLSGCLTMGPPVCRPVLAV